MDFHDPLSAGSHLLGALLSSAAALFLWRFASTLPGFVRASLVAYGLSMVGLYLASGLYHGLRYTAPARAQVWQQLDRSMIYALITGSGCAVIALAFPPKSAWKWQLAVVVPAALGVGAIWLVAKPDYRIVVVLYVVVGLQLLLPARRYLRLWGRTFGWAVACVVFYVGGAVFELIDRPWGIPGLVMIRAHDWLHLCDLAGSACHYVFILKIVAMRRWRLPAG